VLPGQQADQDLRQSMTTPTPEERWRGLPLFGRDLFLGESAQAPVENGPVGPDYVLGPGDNLLVFVSAWSDTTYSLTVDREGQVFLPRIGTTSLWGLSFADADRLIRARLSTVLRNARVQVSMGRMRALEVFVLGSVRKPGKVTLAGSATVLNALVAADGPDTLGSLRDIRVLRADHESRDSISSVPHRRRPPPGRAAADRRRGVRLLTRARVASGDVVRPASASPGPISLRELLRLAGGPTPLADLERVSVERVDANGGFRLQDVPLDHGHGMDPDSLLLSNLDLVTVLPLVGRMRNLVTLDGFVRHPGQYELAPGMKLSDLVRGDRLLPEADLTHAEFRRVDLHDFKTEVRAFSPTRVLAGQEDWPLQPLDAVTVFSSARLPWTVTLQGEETRPGLYTVTPGERLSDLLDRAGGVTPRGSLRAAVFRRRSAARDQRTFTHELEERQRIELLRQQMSLLATGDTVQAAAAGRVESELVDRLGQQSELGRVVLELDAAGKWRKSTRDPVIEDGDRSTCRSLPPPWRCSATS
jgi:protein involved in polysaccharide export with SLBB domain